MAAGAFITRMSLFHGSDRAVTLMFAKDKWTRNEQGTTMCGGGGTAQITVNVEYPLPAEMEDPIAILAGHGNEVVAAGGACTGGGEFDDSSSIPAAKGLVTCGFRARRKSRKLPKK